VAASIRSLRDVPFFKGLGDPELEAVRGCLRERSFEKGQTLFSEGDACERIFFVKSGRVKLYRTSSAGREQILEVLEPGDTCACNPGAAEWHCASSAEALGPVTAWFLSREKYVEFVRKNALVSQTLNRIFAERLHCFSALIEEVSLMDAGKRVAKFLLELLSRDGARPGGTLAVPFTREELAQRLGLARETASRQLSHLQSLKLIDVGPREIVIHSKPGLEKYLAA
jgi:CRP/FNR family transcriptional regulator